MRHRSRGSEAVGTMVLAKLVDSISGRLAFFPPVPTYTVAEHGDGDRALYCKPVSRWVARGGRHHAL